MVGGGCYCGEVRFSIEPPVKGVLHCHCSQCRRLSGTGFSSWVSVPKAQYTLLTGREQLTRFAVTRHSTRFFCARCGTAVHTLDIRYPDIVGVLRGMVHDELEQAPSLHAFYDSRAAWVSVSDGLPCLGGASGFEPLSDG